MTDQQEPGRKPNEATKLKAYQKWLNIPREQCPPNHYRLLGLEVFESDMNRIQAAAKERLSQLRAACGGKPSPLVTELVEELKEAKQTLLHIESKTEYDDNLQSLLSIADLKQIPALAESEPIELTPAQSITERPELSSPAPKQRATKESKSTTIMLVAALLGGVTAVGGFWLFGGFGGNEEDQNHGANRKVADSSQRPDGNNANPPKPGSQGPVAEKSPPAQIDSEQNSATKPPGSVENAQVPVDSNPSPNEAKAALPVFALPVIETLDDLAAVSAIEIRADLPVGCRLGPLKPGSFVLAQYAGGGWSASQDAPEANPDAEQARPAGGRLLIASEDANGKDVMKRVVLPQTAITPFIDEVGQDVAYWNLSIEDFAPDSENRGIVRYRFAMMAPEAAAPSPSKAAIPTMAELRPASSSIQAAFKSQLATAKSPAQIQSLVRKLLTESRTAAGPVKRYAYLELARDLAIRGAGTKVTLEVIHEAAQHFELDETVEQARAIRDLGRRIQRIGPAKDLVPYYEKTVDALLKNAQFVEAIALANDLGSLGSRFRDTELRKAGRELLNVANAQKQSVNATATINRLLKEEPANAKEHDILGKHLAFTLERWDEALRHLARGDDAKLKPLAEKDLAWPKDPAAQEELANSWRDYALSLPKSPEQSAVLRRAGDWYLRAESQAKGDDRLRILKQLEELGEIDDLLKLVDPSIVAKHGDWQLSNGVLTSPLDAWSWIQAHYLPRENYQVTLGARWQSHNEEASVGRDAVLIGLSQGNRQFLIVIDWETQDSEKPFATGFVDSEGKFSWSKPGGHFRQAQPVLKRDQDNTIDVVVEEAGVIVKVNGNEILRHTDGYDRLGLGDFVSGIQPKKLFIGTHHASYLFTRFQVRRIVEEEPQPGNE